MFASIIVVATSTNTAIQLVFFYNSKNVPMVFCFVILYSKSIRISSNTWHWLTEYVREKCHLRRRGIGTIAAVQLRCIILYRIGFEFCRRFLCEVRRKTSPYVSRLNNIPTTRHDSQFRPNLVYIVKLYRMRNITMIILTKRIKKQVGIGCGVY